MATIEKRTPYWRAKVRRKGYPVQTRSFDTRTLAERWARDIERDMDRNVFVDRAEADNNTLQDLVQRYINEVTPTKRGADKEVICLRALMRDPIAQTTMSALSSRRVAEYRDQRLQKVAPSTVNKALNHLGHIIETGRREWGIALPENPVRLVRRPRAGPSRDRRFVGGEEQALFDACEDARNHYLRPVITLALETGMRQGEILSLEWKHVNLIKRVAHLPHTKNGEARSVPLSTKAAETLRLLPRSIDGRVFPRVTTEAIKRAFIRATRRAGIADFHFHDLRHEATSRFFELGLNPMEVASITGHKTLQMLKRYTHLRAEDLARKLG